MPHIAASELGLHCLNMSPIQVSGLKRVKDISPKKPTLHKDHSHCLSDDQTPHNLIWKTKAVCLKLSVCNSSRVP